MADNNTFLIRARKSEITRLQKKKDDVLKRIEDMRVTAAPYEAQIREHDDEIKKLES